MPCSSTYIWLEITLLKALDSFFYVGLIFICDFTSVKILLASDDVIQRDPTREVRDDRPRR